MKKYATAILRNLSTFLEILISFILAAGILILTLKLITTLQHLPNEDIYPNYDDLLATCFNLIIGVELIRMLYQHSPATVFEVLLFAIARQVIIDHSSPVNSLIVVIAIAVFFFTSKFLFSNFDDSERFIFRASSRVDHFIQIIHFTIHYPHHLILRDVLLCRLESPHAYIVVSSCLSFCVLSLRLSIVR